MGSWRVFAKRYQSNQADMQASHEDPPRRQKKETMGVIKDIIGDRQLLMGIIKGKGDDTTFLWVCRPYD